MRVDEYPSPPALAKAVADSRRPWGILTALGIAPKGRVGGGCGCITSGSSISVGSPPRSYFPGGSHVKASMGAETATRPAGRSTRTRSWTPPTPGDRISMGTTDASKRFHRICPESRPCPRVRGAAGVVDWAAIPRSAIESIHDGHEGSIAPMPTTRGTPRRALHGGFDRDGVRSDNSWTVSA